jgi:hypothetical protein
MRKSEARNSKLETNSNYQNTNAKALNDFYIVIASDPALAGERGNLTLEI